MSILVGTTHSLREFITNTSAIGFIESDVSVIKNQVKRYSVHLLVTKF